jgi:hypothetical protein
MIRRRLPGLALCLLPVAGAGAGAGDYAWQWPLGLETGDQPAYLITLDEGIYAALQDPLLRDLEVLDARGRRMPAAMQSALPAATTAIEQVPVRGFLLPGDTPPSVEQLRARFASPELTVELRGVVAAVATAPAQLLLDLGEGSVAVEALQLRPQRDGTAAWLASLQVEGSADLQSWRVLLPRFDAYRLDQDGQPLSALRLALPASPPRYLRLSWLPGSRQGALAGVVAERRREQRSTPSPLRWITLRGEPADEGDGWVFRTPGPLLVERWRVLPAAERWLGNARLDSRVAADAAWQPRAEVASYRIEVDGLWLDDGDHGLVPTREREWRLRWSAALAAPPQLALAFRADQLLFMAEGEPPYRLVAGSASTRRIDAPTSAALAALRARLGAHWIPGRALPGPRGELAGAAALQPASAGERWQRGLLWAVLLAVASSVLVMALRLLRGAGSANGSR